MAENIKISQLVELVSGSVFGTTIVPVVDGGVTLKTQMSSIKAFTNSDVATDTELTNAVSALNNTINALDTSDISEDSSKLYYTDARVKSKLNADGVLSGSLPATFNLGVIADGTSVGNVDSITFYGASLTDDGSGDVSVSINSGSSLNLSIDDGSTTVTSVDSITFSGATVSDDGSGDTTVTIPAATSLNVNSLTGDDVDDVIKISFDGADVSDNGSGEVIVTVSGGTDLTALNTFTGSFSSSIEGRVTTLESIDSDNTQLNTFTGSFSSSIEGRVTTLEGAGGSSVDGTISGSQQITDFGFVSSSVRFVGLGLVSISSASNDYGESVEIQVTPGGGGEVGVAYDADYHIISQSVSLPGESNIILTDVKLGTGINDFKFLDFSESLDSRFGAGGGGDFINNVSIQNHQIDFAGTGNAFAGLVSLPDGIVSSSSQISELGYANTSDINEAYIKDRLPSGTVSGSDQLTDFGFVSNTSTSSFALNDNISGSFTELSESLADRITTNESAAGVTEARLGEVTASILNGGARDGEDNPINLVSSSTQIEYSTISSLPYFIGDGVSITSGSDIESIPYFNLSAGISDYILAHTASLNYHSASISASVDALIVDSGSFSERVTAVEVSSGTARFDSLEARTGSVDNSINEINTFTGSFSASVAQRFEDVEGAGGGADYVSDVQLSGTILTFTGQGSAFNDTVELSSLSTTALTEASFGVVSQSYDLSTTNLQLGNVVIGGTSGDVTLTTVSQSFDSRINALDAAGGATQLSELSDMGNITIDVANGDILLYDSVEQEFTHSKALNGDYTLTGSLDTKGSVDVSGSITVLGTVTADSFIAGDVGTPTINSATDLDMSATNAVNIDGGGINLTAAGSGVILSSSADITVNYMLNLGKTIGEPTTSPATGSIMNSGSIDSDSKLWFFNGTEWKEIAFV